MPALYTDTSRIVLNPDTGIPADYPVENSSSGIATNAIRGLKSAITNYDAGSAASDYYKAAAAGDVQRAGLHAAVANRLATQANRAAPRVRSVGDVHGAGDAADWAAGIVGAAPVSMVGPLGAGLAAGIVARRFGPRAAQAAPVAGSTAAMYPDMRDAARLQQMQSEQQGAPALPAQQVLDDTSHQGAVQAALEGVVPGLAARSLVGQGAKAALSKPVSGALQRIGRDTALDAAAGAGSEYVATKYESGRNPGRDTSGDAMRYIDAAAGEAVVGGGFGVLGHAGDMAHTALGTGLDVGGAVAKAGVKAAMWAGGKTADAAAKAWENRPQSAAEAAIALGKGAAELHTGAEDMLTRAMQQGKDADVDTLLRPAQDKTPQGLMQDADAKHAAAASLLDKIVANPGAYPQYVQEAAGRYGNGKKDLDTWQELSGAVNDWKRSEAIGEGFTEFSQKLSLKVGKQMADAANAAERLKADAVDGFNVGYGDQRAEDGRANAQTPRRNMTPDTLVKVDALRDEFSPLLEKAIAPYTGLHAPLAQAENVGALAHGLREWIANGFAIKKNGKVVVPDGLLQMFKDPVGAVAVAHDLMQRQGLVGTDSALRMASVARHIEIKQEAVKHIGSIVEDNILPTAQAKYGFSGARHEAAGRGMQKALLEGRTNEKVVAELFGPKAALVLDALRTKHEMEHKGYAEAQPEGVQDGVDAGDLDSMTTGMDPNIVGERTQYHHYRDAVERQVDPETGEILREGAPAVPFERKGTVTNRDGSVTEHDAEGTKRAEALMAKNGSSVKQQGYMDYLRERYSGDELRKHMVATMDQHVGKIKDRTRAEQELNDKLYVLREEHATDKGESTDVHPDTFKSVDPRNKSNVWAEFVTLDKSRNPVGGLASEGKIWLERADGKRFATSTNKIIQHISKGTRAESGTGGGDSTYSGLAGQVRMLHQGIASLLASASPEGESGAYGKPGTAGATALKNKIGFREKDGEPIRWLKAGEDFPESLRMHGKDKSTYGDARKAASEAAARVGDREAAKHAGEVAARDAAEQPNTARMRASAETTRTAAAAALKIIENGVAKMSAHLHGATDLVFARTIEGLRALRDTDARQNLWDQILPKGTIVKVGEDSYVERGKYISTIQKRASKALVLHDNEGAAHVGRGAESTSMYAGEEGGMRRSKYEPAETPQGEISKMGDNAALNRAVDEVRTVQRKMPDGTVKTIEVPWPGKEKPYTNEDHTGDTIGVPMRQAVRTSPKLGATPSGSVSVAPPNAVPTATDPNAVPGVKADSVRTKGAILTNPVRFDKDGKVVGAPKQPTVREIALQAQKDAGWNQDWPFVPADLGNADFRDLIRNDPSMSAAEKAQVMSAGHKLGVVPLAESWAPTDLASFYDGLKGGNAELDHNALIAQLDHAALIAELDHAALIAQLKGGEPRYSAMATRLHTDLGREGFAATHDSPIRHEGRFDWRAHHGEGEGNASFGAGTYLSTSDGVHKSYKEQFTAQLIMDAKDRLKNDPGYAALRNELNALYKKGIVPADAISAITSKMFAMEDALPKGPSPTYEVSVNIKPEQLMDWDAPLSEQSELVQKALNDVMKRLKGYDEYKDPTGKKLYHYIEDISGGSGEASDYLQSLGILGHKYAAAGGRNAAHPNYVIYDDSKITTNYVHFSNQDPKHGMFGSEAQPASAEEQAKFHADIARRLGPQIMSGIHAALFGKNSKGKEIPISGQWVKGAIHASLYAHDLGQIGAHEAMHEFFSRLTEAGANKVKDVLLKAANSAPVVRQLERLLDGHTNALAQIKDGAPHAAEERLAYMFQFHQAGLLNLGPETQTVFQKIWNALRKVAGILNDDQQADMILRAFNDGKAQTADAANAVLANHAALRKALYANVNAVYQPMMERASRLVNTAETNLERTGNPVYHEIRTMFKRSVGESGKQGFLDAKDHQMKLWFNRVTAAFEGLNPKDLELAAKYLHTGEKPTDRVVKSIVDKLKGKDGILPAMHKYLKDAGVQLWVPDENNPGEGYWQDMGHVKNYYPRAYDTARIISNPDAFVTDLLAYNGKELQAAADAYNAAAAKAGAEVLSPKTAEDVAKAITNRLTNTFGQAELPDNVRAHDASGKAALKEGKGHVGFTPFMESVNKRSLHWIAPEILAKYGEKDVAKTITAYVAQGVKRAEYVRRFGNAGEKLQDMLKDAHEQQLKRLVDSGMDPKEAEIKALKIAKGAATDVMAMEGTLGYDISPTMRRINNSALVYENLRVLSTSLFSQLIDPMALVVRGGTMGDAWNAYKRGMREVVSSIKNDSRIKDRDSEIADLVGTTDSGGMLAAFGQLYSSQYMGAGFRKANDMLFKYNGMEGFNRGMQVSGTRAAIGFIKRHVEKPGPNSEAYLAELNLKAKDVKIDANGDLDYHNPKIKEAIHQWVNGAVMRPNAAQRPAWGSDPHYMMFWHMKQFAYTFHDVIMKRALHDYRKFGDLGPAGVLVAAFTPIMVASDAMKSLLLTGSEPPWMKAGLASEIEHGVMRAGLGGKFQPLLDVATNPHRSVLGLGGPVVEQITQMFTATPGDSAVNALPGANLWNQIGGKSHIEVQGED